MNAQALILLLIFAAGAGFIQRVTGFGFGIFIMAVLPHIMPSYGEATALSGMLALVGVCITGYRVRRSFCFRKFWLITLTFLVVSFFAVRVVTVVDGRVLKRVLGAMLVAASIYFIFFSGRFTLKPSPRVQLGMGTLSGIMGGLFAMQGPPAVIYFLSCTEDKDEYMALASFYFIVGNLMMTGYRALGGLVTPSVCKSWLVALPAVVIGILVGELVYRKMPVELLRKCVYIFIGIAGIIALL